MKCLTTVIYLLTISGFCFDFVLATAPPPPPPLPGAPGSVPPAPGSVPPAPGSVPPAPGARGPAPAPTNSARDTIDKMYDKAMSLLKNFATEVANDLEPAGGNCIIKQGSINALKLVEDSVVGAQIWALKKAIIAPAPTKTLCLKAIQNIEQMFQDAINLKITLSASLSAENFLKNINEFLKNFQNHWNAFYVQSGTIGTPKYPLPVGVDPMKHAVDPLVLPLTSPIRRLPTPVGTTPSPAGTTPSPAGTTPSGGPPLPPGGSPPASGSTVVATDALNNYKEISEKFRAIRTNLLKADFMTAVGELKNCLAPAKLNAVWTDINVTTEVGSFAGFLTGEIKALEEASNKLTGISSVGTRTELNNAFNAALNRANELFSALFTKGGIAGFKPDESLLIVFTVNQVKADAAQTLSMESLKSIRASLAKFIPKDKKVITGVKNVITGVKKEFDGLIKTLKKTIETTELKKTWPEPEFKDKIEAFSKITEDIESLKASVAKANPENIQLVKDCFDKVFEAMNTAFSDLFKESDLIFAVDSSIIKFTVLEEESPLVIDKIKAKEHLGAIFNTLKEVILKTQELQETPTKTLGEFNVSVNSFVNLIDEQTFRKYFGKAYDSKSLCIRRFFNDFKRNFSNRATINKELVISAGNTCVERTKEVLNAIFTELAIEGNFNDIWTGDFSLTLPKEKEPTNTKVGPNGVEETCNNYKKDFEKILRKMKKIDKPNEDPKPILGKFNDLVKHIPENLSTKDVLRDLRSKLISLFGEISKANDLRVAVLIIKDAVEKSNEFWSILYDQSIPPLTYKNLVFEMNIKIDDVEKKKVVKEENSKKENKNISLKEASCKSYYQILEKIQNSLKTSFNDRSFALIEEDLAELKKLAENGELSESESTHLKSLEKEFEEKIAELKDKGESGFGELKAFFDKVTVIKAEEFWGDIAIKNGFENRKIGGRSSNLVLILSIIGVVSLLIIGVGCWYFFVYRKKKAASIVGKTADIEKGNASANCDYAENPYVEYEHEHEYKYEHEGSESNVYE